MTVFGLRLAAAAAFSLLLAAVVDAIPVVEEEEGPLAGTVAIRPSITLIINYRKRRGSSLLITTRHFDIYLFNHGTRKANTSEGLVTL